jgi:pilus assembly protein TadC
LLPYVLGRLEPAQTRRDRLRIAADLPVAVELVSACLASGAPPAASLAVVAGAVGGPLGLRLGRVAGALQLGADPASAWAPFAATTELGPLARAMIRAYDSGAPRAATLDRTALDLRAQQRASAAEAAQAVAVKAVGPLGACFLPAFVLLGVVPTVWGIAITTFGGWA